jgi:heat shock protein HslJ
MKLYVHYLTIIFISLLLLSCSSSKKEQSETKFEDIEWKLESLNGSPAVLANGKYATILFASALSKFNGSAVCNKYFGQYSKSGNTITIKEIGSTKMMCENDNIDESSLFNALKSVDSFEIISGKLNLKSNGKTIAVFVR